MSYWSSETLKQRGAEGHLISDFKPNAVKHGAYELSLGPETFLTSDEDNKKKTLEDGQQVVIPPGQFGLLLTEEKVTIPGNAIGFISIKAGIKFRGLVNVSGFHVDPGFAGRLKFSVYNAGSQNIVLQRKQPVFLLWLSDLDQATTDLYDGVHAYQSEITPNDVMLIQGKVASPGQLQHEIKNLENKIQTEIKELEHRVDNLKWVFTVVAALLVSVLGFALRGCLQSGVQSSPIQQTPSTTIQKPNPSMIQSQTPQTKP